MIPNCPGIECALVSFERMPKHTAAPTSSSQSPPLERVEAYALRDDDVGAAVRLGILSKDIGAHSIPGQLRILEFPKVGWGVVADREVVRG